MSDSDWRDSLGSFLSTAERRKQEKAGYGMAEFIRDVVAPAFEEISRELAKYDRQIATRQTEASATLTVTHAGNEEITYRVQGRTFPNGIRPFAEVRFRERKGLRLITVENMFRSGNSDYTLEDVTRDEVIANFIDTYTSRCARDDAG